MSYKVTIQDSDESFEISEGQNVRDLLAKEGIYIKSSCGGHGKCADCMVKIIAGEDFITPMTFSEIKNLGNVFHLTKERLSCQLQVSGGDVVIDIGHHDEKRDKNKILGKKHKSIKVRKKTEVSALKSAKEKETEESESLKQKNSERWANHWEKKDDTEALRPAKKMGGGRRPRPFLTPDDEPMPLPESDPLKKE